MPGRNAIHYSVLGRPPPVRQMNDLSGVDCFFVGIGAQKAATTWLYQMLAKAPDVHLAPVKEVHFWDTWRIADAGPRFRNLARRRRLSAAANVLRALVGRRSFKGSIRKMREANAYVRLLERPSVERYVSFVMRGHAGQRVVGEITPNYARLSRGDFADVSRIHANTRFIFIMRDPVERLWSGIRQEFKVYGLDDQKAMLAEFAKALEEPDSRHFQRSDYRRTMQELEAAVSVERVLYLFYESLFSPENGQRVADFLGIPSIEWQGAQRVHVGMSADTRLSDDLRRRARGTYAPVYEHVSNVFGPAVPAEWRVERGL